ncbi:MAG: universal stress protein UspA [Proteocatella sp.]
MTGKRVMVCVTDQKVCEKLIYNALDILETSPGEIHVVHVSRENVIQNEESGEALEYLFGICTKFNATLTLIKSQNILNSLAETAIKNKIDTIIMGESRNLNPETSIICELKKKIGNKVEISVVPTI